MTTKQRAFLRKESNSLEAIYQIGKNGIEKNLLVGIDEALEAHELIKITVHETSEKTAREVADILSSSLKADTVQVIGRKIILYRLNKKLNRYGV